MAHADKTITSLTLTPNLTAISAANPFLQLTPRQVAAVNAGNLVIVPSPSGVVPVPRGCLTYLRFGDSDEDLDLIAIDGVTYGNVGPNIAENIREFKDTFLKAACCHICINFCWDKEEKRIFMVNLYPCSECRPNERCGCGDN